MVDESSDSDPGPARPDDADGLDDADDSGRESPSPDDAFALLGNETRLAVLRTLGHADDPLSFSALRDQVGMTDSGQFNYHLEQLVGHFVEKSDEGYDLRRPGRRVVEAILSGAVTGDPAMERTAVDETCEFCGAPVEAEWHAGSVHLYCTECAGRHSRTGDDAGGGAADQGYLGRVPLPPAGVQNRTPDEAVRAAWTWGNLEIMAMASGMCPRCSATVEHSVRVCEDHDADGGRCESCGNRYAVGLGVDCTNCIFHAGGTFAIRLIASSPLLAFLLDHDVNPIAPASIDRINGVQGDYAEEVRSTDPFEARFTFDLDGDTLALTVDENLDVVAVER